MWCLFWLFLDGLIMSWWHHTCRNDMSTCPCRRQLYKKNRKNVQVAKTIPQTDPWHLIEISQFHNSTKISTKTPSKTFAWSRLPSEMTSPPWCFNLELSSFIGDPSWSTNTSSKTFVWRQVHHDVNSSFPVMLPQKQKLKTFDRPKTSPSLSSVRDPSWKTFFHLFYSLYMFDHFHFYWYDSSFFLIFLNDNQVISFWGLKEVLFYLDFCLCKKVGVRSLYSEKEGVCCKAWACSHLVIWTCLYSLLKFLRKVSEKIVEISWKILTWWIFVQSSTSVENSRENLAGNSYRIEVEYCNNSWKFPRLFRENFGGKPTWGIVTPSGRGSISSIISRRIVIVTRSLISISLITVISSIAISHSVGLVTAFATAAVLFTSATSV